MRVLDLVSVILARLGPTSATPLPESHIGRRSFVASCSSYGIEPRNGVWTLFARCKNFSGNYQDSSLNLNLCITNNDGVLRWQYNGQWQSTCSNIQAAGWKILTANCYDKFGRGHNTQIDLDTGISNYNGMVRCW